MAGFNGSGTFVRSFNWVTDKSNSVLVTASRFDTEDDGFATGLSTAICKDGQTTTTVAIPFAVGLTVNAGSAGTPSIGFSADTDTGIYGIGANNIGIAAGGAKVIDIGTATSSVAGALVVGGPVNAACFRNYIAGFTLSNDSGTPNTIIDIAAGSCMDSGNTNMMVGAAITKTIGGTFTVGTGQGGLDTGAAANSTWYHVFIIMRPDTGVVDALISTSATSPTMPSNYTKKRRIGSFKTDASAHIIPFTQFGDEFLWKNPPVDRNGVAVATTQTLITLTVPTNVNVYGITQALVLWDGSHADSVGIYAPDMGSQGANTWISGSTTMFVNTNATQQSSWMKTRTNTSAQIAAAASGGTALVYVNTLGWIDRRGIDA